MNDAAHLGDEAEIYALGALDPVERAAVEAHITTCSECAQRVAAAEAVAASLASALPAYEPPARLGNRIANIGRSPWTATPLWTRGLAAAAVLVIALLGWQNFILQGERGRTTVALATIVNSHFLHVMMTKGTPAAPNAKILYARDGAWLYVVVDRPAPGVHVLLGDAPGSDAGLLRSSGSVSTLFVPNAGRPNSVTLRDANGVVERAKLIY